MKFFLDVSHPSIFLFYNDLADTILLESRAPISRIDSCILQQTSSQAEIGNNTNSETGKHMLVT